MKNLIRLNALLFSFIFTAEIFAAEIQITDAWAKTTLPGQDAGMVSLTITSKHAATLVGVSSHVARSVEIHRMSHENGMMKMREVKSITLPAGKHVDFEKAGYHLMLVGLQSVLKEGNNVALILNIQAANESVVKVETLATVKPLAATQEMDKEDAHPHHH